MVAELGPPRADITSHKMIVQTVLAEHFPSLQLSLLLLVRSLFFHCLSFSMMKVYERMRFKFLSFPAHRYSNPQGGTTASLSSGSEFGPSNCPELPLLPITITASYVITPDASSKGAGEDWVSGLPIGPQHICGLRVLGQSGERLETLTRGRENGDGEGSEK